METYRINRKNNNVANKLFFTADDIREFSMSGSSVCIKTTINAAADLSEGSMLHFEKTASGTSGESLKVCEIDTPITEIIDVWSADTRFIFFDYTLIEALTLDSFIEISRLNEEDPEPEYKYKMYFTENFMMVPGDFEKYYEETGKEYSVYVKHLTSNILSYTGLAFCYPMELVKGEDRDEHSDCSVQFPAYFNYETMEKDSVLCKGFSLIGGEEFVPAAGDAVMPSTNPYYFTNSGGKMVLFDGVTISRYGDYMNIGLNVQEDYDTKRMFQEYQVNDLFVKKITSKLVPGFTDLEKIKYSPAYKEAGETRLATGLTFNLHFKTRISGMTKHSFDDTWYFGSETTANTTWNNNTGNPIEKGNLYDNADFVNSSNLMGFLGFTDDDVYNQKNKVGKSFIRLSFYEMDDEKINPLTQRLLFYSTIFFDTGELYGKFIKKKNELIETVPNYIEAERPVVWESGSTDGGPELITSQINVNDEYDTTKSSEGFNLYLFKEDAPLENEVKNIYMRVEFNHAGYGRTVPFIFWKKNENTGKPIDLTIGNYLENLYIRVMVKNVDGNYVYYFPDIEADQSSGIRLVDERIVFNLFEPDIEKEKDEQ